MFTLEELEDARQWLLKQNTIYLTTKQMHIIVQLLEWQISAAKTVEEMRERNRSVAND